MKKLFFISSLLLVFGLTTLSFAQAQVESGKWRVMTSDYSYTLDENEGDRSMTIDVSFDVPFDEKPDIILGVTMMMQQHKPMLGIVLVLCLYQEMALQ